MNRKESKDGKLQYSFYAESLKGHPEKISNAYVEFAKRILEFKTEVVLPKNSILTFYIEKQWRECCPNESIFLQSIVGTLVVLVGFENSLLLNNLNLPGSEFLDDC